MKSFWPTIDSKLSLFIEQSTPHYLERVSAWISAIADVEYILIVALLLVGYFVFHKKWHNVVIIALSTGMTTIVVSFLKDFFMVTRPQNGFHVILNNASFPSGHAGMAAAFFTALLVIYLPIISSKFNRILFISVCATATSLIGISRLLLNVHWLSDVIAGWGIGILIALLAGWFSSKLKIKKLFRK